MALDLPRVEYDKKERKTQTKENILSHVSTDLETARLNSMPQSLKEPEWTQMKLSELPVNTQDNTNTHG